MARSIRLSSTRTPHILTVGTSEAVNSVPSGLATLGSPGMVLSMSNSSYVEIVNQIVEDYMGNESL